MAKPNWQIKFRELPVIPRYKQWSGKNFTIEQMISYKLVHGQSITKTEEQIFISLGNFYSELDSALCKLDFTTFTAEDFENFKNYILYAFNFTAIMSNEVTFFQIYRLVVNEWVTGKNERINDVSFLTYPQIDIVRKAKKYNRANSPNTNLFYATQNIDTCLKELRPSVNKLLTVGVWKPSRERTFMSYPISHSDVANKINESVDAAMVAFEKQKKVSGLFMDYLAHYFKLLGREYTKVVNHHFEYYISALFSESILTAERGPTSGPIFDCIIYPSVGNEYVTDNFAIRPDVIDKDFYLDHILEFEVDEPYYDRPYKFDHPENMTLAKIKNLRGTNSMDNGKILW